ncbi:MAG: phospholipid-binding protein [Henriciella sp.]|mgnify:CR=1 FL=1|jgi:osmotically-inducible protein OsmY|uniref:BON domain-containing protein n=1 Tax=Henriciella sp. TaxID=1968823 RepID=UPI000C0CD40F|nr:BON domain-containing protein [Henriciella sp.]MAN73005.1 phospholipid-binding protein [Henriciella sp.]MBF32995.1 phospholipid-binding protein [Hyphomonadaceae bacterium]MBK76920.1 phospholipid-binding protein [Henriciella sp.]PHR77857.1 MAG: phospholipid-binding protein [Henriciella sp.]|tara:strand:- start:3927 stop:4574 length:648 start_codon:yes stop_codon:yes gene_type:complete
MVLHRFLAPALLGAFSLGGCVAAAVGTAGAVGLASVQERTLGEAVDDATASNEIKAKLLNENGYGEVDVEVANGLALLSGRVSSPEMRVRAEQIAWSSSRITDVANEIQIEKPGGFMANASDELITARVRSSLLSARNVKSLNFNIETYNGVVYLMGLARSEEELETAAQRASVVQGVERVVSYVRVREPHQRQAAPAGNTGGGSDEELLGGNVY